MFKKIALLLLLVALATAHSEVSAEKINLCPVCVQLMDQALNELIQIIANGGVVGGCAELCGLIPNQYLALTCDLVCDYVGIEEFVKIIEKADPDPVWICMEMRLCPLDDNGYAYIKDVQVAPAQGPAGTTFTISIDYVVVNKTGTAEIACDVSPPDGMPFGGGELLVGADPGSYQWQSTVDTTPTEDEEFSPGIYQVEAGACEVDCSCTHNHCKVWDDKTTSFTIVQ